MGFKSFLRGLCKVTAWKFLFQYHANYTLCESKLYFSLVSLYLISSGSVPCSREDMLSISITRYLYKDELIPKNTKIIGYARSDLTVDKLRAKVEPFMKVSVDIEHYVVSENIHTCPKPKKLWWKGYGFFSGTTHYRSKGLTCKAGDCVLLYHSKG